MAFYTAGGGGYTEIQTPYKTREEAAQAYKDMFDVEPTYTAEYDVAFGGGIGGKKSWPPNDTTLMTSADWVH